MPTMRWTSNLLFTALGLSLCLGPLGCASDDDGGGDGDGGDGDGGNGPRLIIVVDVDPTQVRLDNFGDPAPAPPMGHAATAPTFLSIATSSAELVPNETTLIGDGTALYDTPEKNGGADFSQIRVGMPRDELASIPLADIAPGTYPYLRMAVAYQRFVVPGHATFMGVPVTADVEVAAFVEDDTYIESYEIGDTSVTVNALKAQGYYGAWSMYTGVIEGQAPVGATTVPNPLDSTSPIPVESCVVTGIFDQPLEITGDEKNDIVLHISMSTNDSFEWVDDNADGKWQPFDEAVVDMGLRGMVVTVQ